MSVTVLHSTSESTRPRRPWRPRCSATGQVCRFRSDGTCAACTGSRHPAPAIGVPPEASHEERLRAF